MTDTEKIIAVIVIAVFGFLLLGNRQQQSVYPSQMPPNYQPQPLNPSQPYQPVLTPNQPHPTCPDGRPCFPRLNESRD